MLIASRRLTSGFSSVGAACVWLFAGKGIPGSAAQANQSCRSYGAKRMGDARSYKHAAPKRSLTETGRRSRLEIKTHA